MPSQLELGLDTFGDVTYDADGQLLPQAQVIRNVVAEAVLADQLGLDFIGVGEHHRDDFAISAPDVVLAAIAGQTQRIRLGSAVTVLSSDDPVRVFQRFSTLDAVSGGRAEVILGRGSFTESFPLFGYPLDQYEQLFEEKLDLFAELLKQQPVTWSGQTRAALTDKLAYPPTESGRLMTWVAVGGSPDSVVRAARYGLPMMLAIIGGMPERFVPFAELHRRAGSEAGHEPPPTLGINSHTYVAETSERAADEFFPAYAAMMNAVGRERGWSPIGRREFDQLRSPRGALAVGSAEEVAEKILFEHELFHHDRFLAQISVGTLPHAHALRAIELYGTEVAPRVRAEVAARAG
jgi:probable LLM family oxidoreductase